jgi:prolyl-tRNA editing enzyme YbaK/EbsC (Cys-tRNA(Pro) deacylase)
VAGAADRFVDAASRAGLTVQVRRFAEETRTAPDAARAIGCNVAQIVKSLVLMADGEPFVALTSGGNRADPDRLARLLGAKEVRRATPEEACEATGFAIGGTPPLGYVRPIRVLMDGDLLDHEVVWAAAGAPDTVFPVAPSALRSAAGAEVADFKEAG